MATKQDTSFDPPTKRGKRLLLEEIGHAMENDDEDITRWRIIGISYLVLRIWYKNGDTIDITATLRHGK